MPVTLSREEYQKQSVAHFCRVRDEWGVFSNMHRPEKEVLTVGGREWLSTEAIYQALRFPDHPEVQERVRQQKSPMTAKMVTKPFRETCSRSDWKEVKVEIMQWCLRLKLAQWFRHVYWPLIQSDPLPIVEISTKNDEFWGTTDQGGRLIGCNALGRLWMGIRQEVIAHPTSLAVRKAHFTVVPPPTVPMTLFGVSLT